MTKSIEQFLQKVQSVIGSKVIMDDQGKIEEIHIVSDLRRSPKQILRDIEAILISEFDQAVDYKKISIAQVKGETASNEQDPRIKLKSIEYGNCGTSIDVSVTLEKFGELYISTANGIKTSSNVIRLSGIATLKAVEEYLGINDVFVFDDCESVALAGGKIVVVAITSIYHHREETFIGTSKVVSDINESVTRATLDAINRHILQLETL